MLKICFWRTYQEFKINDPKPRVIHKASARDRILHRAVYRILYPYFDRKFICDSYSCRNGKGTHKALHQFEQFARKVSKNNTKQCWVLKCDIQKFFASVDRGILLNILRKYINDDKSMGLLEKIVFSFQPGLPLGNLTSQLFANIYLNEFDQFIKHKLKIKFYIRYTDDFVIFYQDKEFLQSLIPLISGFLSKKLHLKLHPNKISIISLRNGVDFLGWINFADCRTLRTKTKKRILDNIFLNKDAKILNSYFGLLKHGNTRKFKSEILYGLK